MDIEGNAGSFFNLFEQEGDAHEVCTAGRVA